MLRGARLQLSPPARLRTAKEVRTANQRQYDPARGLDRPTFERGRAVWHDLHGARHEQTTRVDAGGHHVLARNAAVVARELVADTYKPLLAQVAPQTVHMCCPTKHKISGHEGVGGHGSEMFKCPCVARDLSHQFYGPRGPDANIASQKGVAIQQRPVVPATCGQGRVPQRRRAAADVVGKLSQAVAKRGTKAPRDGRGKTVAPRGSPRTATHVPEREPQDRGHGHGLRRQIGKMHNPFAPQLQHAKACRHTTYGCAADPAARHVHTEPVIECEPAIFHVGADGEEELVQGSLHRRRLPRKPQPGRNVCQQPLRRDHVRSELARQRPALEGFTVSRSSRRFTGRDDIARAQAQVLLRQTHGLVMLIAQLLGQVRRALGDKVGLEVRRHVFVEQAHVDKIHARLRVNCVSQHRHGQRHVLHAACQRPAQSEPAPVEGRGWCREVGNIHAVNRERSSRRLRGGDGAWA